MKVLQNIFVITLIAATQFGSLGILLNKHYCKGALAEVSVLLSYKGCSEDFSFFDRLNHTEHDCHKTADDNGIKKAPSCDFESTFSKIYLFQEDLNPINLNVEDVVISASNYDQRSIAFCPNIVWSFVPRPPPDTGVETRLRFCRFLI